MAKVEVLPLPLPLPMVLFLPLAMVMVSGGGIHSVFDSVFGIANGNGNAKSAVFGNNLLQISSGTKASS